MDILMMLIFQSHEHGIYSIYLCLPWYLSSVLYSFLSTGLLPPWLGLLLGTLFFLLLYQMGFFFLFFVSDIHCWCTKNAFDFWVFTLYSCVLPNSLLGSNSFLVESIGFSMYTIMSSANSEFHFLRSNLDAFYCFFLSDCCG